MWNSYKIFLNHWFGIKTLKTKKESKKMDAMTNRIGQFINGLNDK